MRFVVEHEKHAFKEKGLIPWSRPMRKWLLQYGRELHEAQRTIGTSFDAAIERAGKGHNDKLKAALIAEAGQDPRSAGSGRVATRGQKGKSPSPDVFLRWHVRRRRVNQRHRGALWVPSADDVLILEFPDKEDAAETPTSRNSFSRRTAKL